MKPKILHIPRDKQMGGVTSSLENLNNSRLGEAFEFQILPLTELLAHPKVLSAYQPDVILWHVACSWKHLRHLWYCQHHAKLAICEHHYAEYFDQLVPSRRRFHTMLQINYRLADRLVALSQGQAQWIRHHHPRLTSKLTVIPQARSLDAFLAIPPISPSPEVLRLGAYGRFSSEKGFTVLLQALQQIPEVPIQVYLGGEGAEQAQLETLAQGLKQVQFVGMVRDVPQFLENCDVIVVPSLREVWGFTCMEAKAAARPVIASRVGGLIEQIEGNDCGLLVPPHDPAALAAAIVKLCTLPKSTLVKWGQAGRESVRGVWEHHLNQWEQLLWQLIQS
jgi:glycosyltransferase involved in cell wall biosynthesis